MQETRAILKELIAFDTVSRHSNLEMIEWIANYLRDLGLAVRYTYNEERTKANVLCLFGGRVGEPPIVLSGHTDVVPVDGQVWHVPPFELTEKDGRYYGRGTCDMKGFIAVCLAKVAEWHRTGLAQALSMGLAFSFDEEVGCLGVKHLLADLQKTGTVIGSCVIGEPTMMQPIIAHKGIAHYQCNVHGHAMHSSLTPHGVNAIEYAAKVINYVRELADEAAVAGQRHPLFDVPFNTLQTGLIHGGNAANIVPADCEFVVEHRWLPSENPQRFLDKLQAYATQLEQTMQTVAPSAHIKIEELVFSPAFEASLDSELLAWVRELCAGKTEKGVAYSTEAGYYEMAQIPSVVCGPGDIQQAHKPDEFVSIQQLADCAAWLEALAQKQVQKFSEPSLP